jgi:hypothetical protein
VTFRKPILFDAELHVELWKQSVTVQQHFNDIGWRIRAIALTALTFTFGATGLTYANTAPVHVGAWVFSAAVFVPFFGLILWWAFWFMDAKWFHRLLIGSVIDGARLEKLLREHGVEAGLGDAISASSAVKLWPYNEPVRSTDRLNLFYKVIAVILGLTALATLIIGPPPARTFAPADVTVNVTPAEPTMPPLATRTPSPTPAVPAPSPSP